MVNENGAWMAGIAVRTTTIFIFFIFIFFLFFGFFFFFFLVHGAMIVKVGSAWISVSGSIIDFFVVELFM